MRRSVRRIRRRFFAACFMFLFTVTVIAGHSMLTTLAEEESPRQCLITAVLRFRKGTVSGGLQTVTGREAI